MAIAESVHHISSLASRLLRAGRFPEAIDAHNRLLELDPGQADGWYNLGYLLQRTRRYEEALESYRRALNCNVACPEEVHLNRAVILAEHLARGEDAEREISMALNLNPNYVPAHLNLGNIHEQFGARIKAINAYEQVLLIEPDNALALARLAGLQNFIGTADSLIGKLESELSRPEATNTEQADLGFGLGKALDSVGEYDRAFAAYVSANRASRLSSGPQGIHYDRKAHERYIDRLIAAFPEPALCSNFPEGSPRPLFVCGMFRSGSTLIEQILASHPRVTGGGEIDLLPAMSRKYLSPLLKESNKPVDGRLLFPLRDEYTKSLSLLFPNADIVIDKRPDNFMNIGLIKILFPSAKIIHTRRNPIDNCLSVFFLHLSHTMPYALDLLDIAHWYKQYERLMAHWKALYPDDIYDVDYDALVSDLRSNIERLLIHCGLSWADACMAFHVTKTVVATPSAWQVRQPLYASSSGRWRHYDRHLNDLRAALDSEH